MEVLKSTPVLSDIPYSPNTFSSAQDYSFIIKRFIIFITGLDFLPCYNANKYSRKWTVRLFTLSLG